MVEQQPSKLNTRVRFPSPAPRFLRHDTISCDLARLYARLSPPPIRRAD